MESCWRKRRTLAWSAERREGWAARMDRAAEDVVASIAGKAAEKTAADEFIRCKQKSVRVTDCGTKPYLM